MPNPFMQALLLAGALSLPYSLASAGDQPTRSQPVSAQPSDSIEHLHVQGQRPQRAATVIDVASVYRPGMQLSELLRQVPGLHISQPGGPGGDMRISLQGSSSGQVLVLLDGEPLTSSTLGTPLIQGINPADLAAIEVLRGAAAAAYGSGALAGVIHFRSQQQAAATLSANTLSGSAAGEQLYGRVAEQLNARTFVSVSGGHQRVRQSLTPREAEAARYQPAYQQDQVNLNVRRETQGGNDLRLRHQRTSAGADYQLPCIECEPWLRSRQNLSQVEHRKQDGDRERTLTLSQLTDQASSLDRQQQTADWLGFNERFQSKRYRAAYVSERSTGRDGLVTRGIDWQREYAQSNAVDYANHTRAKLALFNQWQTAQGSGLGVRAERLGSGSWVAAGHLGLARAFSADTRGSLRLSNSYREPGFNDLYWPQAGNPDLRRERNRSLQGELVYSGLSNTRVTLQPFYQQWRDLIAWAPSAGDVWAPQNTARASSVGATLITNWQLTEHWFVDADLTLQRPQDDDSGNTLAYRPRQFAQVQSRYQRGHWQLGATAEGRGAVYSSAGERLSGFYTVHANFAYQALNTLSIQLDAKNLLDRAYVEGGDWFEAGRQLRLGFTWRY